MKPLLIASFALAALPLAAAEPPQAQPATTTAATTTAAPAPPPAATADSPLVKAAKASATKSKNKRKATITITNDTLLKSGGHITTTANQPPLPPALTHPSEEQLRAEKARRDAEAKVAAARAEAEKKEQERRKAVAERFLEAQEGGATADALYDDPAVAEHRAEQVSTTTGEKKPPR